MATWLLPANTLFSSLMPSGGGSLAAGDTINLDGHNLIVDVDAVDYPVTLSNTGAVAHMEGRDRARIKLNATLPSTICPWVDPAHPLPVADPDHAIDGDAFRTNLTANARFEIQLNGTTFGLGGGSASLPTATRSGNFWAIVASSDSTTTLKFDRDFPLHAGDYIVNLTIYNALQKVQVTAYDPVTRTATLATAPERRTVGDTWSLLAGGVCINKVSTSANNQVWFSSPVSGGTICLFSNYTGTSSNGSGFFSRVFADRVLCGMGRNGGNSTPLISSDYYGVVYLGQVACGGFRAGGNYFPMSCVGELVTSVFSPQNTSTFTLPSIVKRIRVCGSIFANISGTSFIQFLSGTLAHPPSVNNNAAVRLVDCEVEGERMAEVWMLASGTVSRTARTNFPADTDLPDAQYHAPNAAGAVTWRYEDRWVRKGETLRMRARWMPAGASSKASVAVTELVTWWPDLWTLGNDALAKAEFAAGMEQLRWYDGSLEWRNDTGEDCQVRVWECVCGDTLGGYLRVWEATGGAM